MCLSPLYHSTRRITRRRFMRSRACTRSLLSSTARRRSTVRFASPRYSPKMRLASSTARMMVSWSGLFMTVRQLYEIGIQDGGRIFVPLWRCGFMSRRLNATVARSGHSRVGLINPGRLSRETHNEGDDYHGCKRCREPKQSQPGIGSLIHFPSPSARSIMVTWLIYRSD